MTATCVLCNGPHAFERCPHYPELLKALREIEEAQPDREGQRAILARHGFELGPAAGAIRDGATLEGRITVKR